MVEICKKQIRVVTGSTPTEFQDNLNETFNWLCKEGFKYDEPHFNDSMGLCCYITYEYFESKPENAHDKHSLKNDLYMCSECPFYRLPTDGRVRDSYCAKAKQKTRANYMCCDLFYELLDKGEIQPNL